MVLKSYMHTLKLRRAVLNLHRNYVIYMRKVRPVRRVRRHNVPAYVERTSRTSQGPMSYDVLRMQFLRSCLPLYLTENDGSTFKNAWQESRARKRLRAHPHRTDPGEYIRSLGETIARASLGLRPERHPAVKWLQAFASKCPNQSRA